MLFASRITLLCSPTTNTKRKSQPFQMESIIATIVCLAQLFDPVVLTVMLTHIIRTNLDEIEKTFVSFSGRRKLLSFPWFQLRNKTRSCVSALCPSKVNEIFDEIETRPRQLIIRSIWHNDWTINQTVVPSEYTKNALFHVMTFRTMFTFVHQYNNSKWSYYASDSDFFLQKHFDCVRKLVAEFYLKNFASPQESMKSVYQYMDNNDVTYEHFVHGYRRYSDTYDDRVLFTDLFDVYNYYMEMSTMSMHPYGDYHVTSMKAIIDHFDKHFDLTSFVNKKLLTKEYEPILLLRSNINEHKEQQDYFEMDFQEYDDDDYIPPSTKKDYHSAKMSKRKARGKSPKHREQNRRGGRRKCRLVEQYC